MPSASVATRDSGRDFAGDGPAELIAGCLEGDQQAWAALVERYSPLVWTVARSHRLSTEDCEEVYQLSWLRVYQSLETIRTPERFAAWVTTCARRESLKQYERSARYVPVLDHSAFDQRAEQGSGPEDVLLFHERRDTVLAALRELPERDQALLALLMADPAPSYEELSRRLGIARGSVGPLRGRALRRLADRLAAVDRDEPTAGR